MGFNSLALTTEGHIAQIVVFFTPQAIESCKILRNQLTIHSFHTENAKQKFYQMRGDLQTNATLTKNVVRPSSKQHFYCIFNREISLKY